MNWLLKILILSCLTSALKAQNDTLYSGTKLWKIVIQKPQGLKWERQYYPNGQLQYDGHWRNSQQGDLRMGEWRHYCDNGQVQRQEHWEDNRLTGDFTQWYCNGTLLEKKHFKIIEQDGLLKSVEDGWYVSYYLNGQVRDSVMKKNDKPHGIWLSYYDNGLLQSRRELSEGVPDGEELYYFENGAINKQRNHRIIIRNGNRIPVEHGRQVEWAMDGKMLWERFMYEGNPVGISRRFYEDGELQEYTLALMTLSNNGYEATFRFYPDGALRELQFHRFMLPKYFFYPDGKLKFVEENVRDTQAVRLTWTSDGRLIGNEVREQPNRFTFVDQAETNRAKGYQRFFSGMDRNSFQPIGSNFTGSWSFPAGFTTPLIQAGVRNGRLDGSFILRDIELDTLAWFNMKAGIPEGKFRIFSNRKILLQEGEVKDGKMEGVWGSYKANGGIIRKEVFNDSGEVVEQWEGHQESNQLKVYQNKVTGEVREYYEDGTLYLHRTPLGDIPGFEIRYFYPKGELKEIYLVSDSSFARQGPTHHYYENGQLEYILRYKDNKRNGEYKKYHPNGRLAAEGQFDMDKPVGEWKMYREDGTFKESMFYRDGQLVITGPALECACPATGQGNMTYVPLLEHFVSYEDVKRWSFPFHAPIDSFYEHLFYRGQYGNKESGSMTLIAFQEIYLWLPDSMGLKLLLNPCEGRRQMSSIKLNYRIDPIDRWDTWISVRPSHSAIEFDADWLVRWDREKREAIKIEDHPVASSLTFQVEQINYTQNGLEAEGVGNFCFPYSKFSKQDVYLDFEEAEFLFNNNQNELRQQLRGKPVGADEWWDELNAEYDSLAARLTGLFIPEGTMNIDVSNGSLPTGLLTCNGQYLLLNNSFLKGLIFIPVSYVQGDSVEISIEPITIRLKKDELLRQIEMAGITIKNSWFEKKELIIWFELLRQW